MQAVNLLPEYARGGRRWTAAGSELSSRRILPIGGLAAVGLALLLGLFYFHERSLVSDKKSELATQQARLVAQSARAEPIKQAQAASQARLTFMRSVTASRVHWDSVLGDLGRVLPTGVSLTTLTAAAPVAAAAAVPGAAPTTTGSTFTTSGTTSSHDHVALILDRLALLPWLSNVTLLSTTRAGSGVTFTVNATYVGGSGS
jgi:Tfp pilus assembly protein PilN